jgi:asparagine synthase (glutamine-hydrolysing)
MCGICGIYGVDDRQIVKKMSDTLSHRGPDDEGFFVDKDISLGHRRLSIIDLNTGHQPIHNEDETVWIVFNGEIYNYKELRAELEKKHRFYTNTDTEVIVHCYEEYGNGFADRLNGMFALALWDSNKKTLVLARDPIGKKPLYYWSDGGKLIFASEIKAILAAGVPAGISEEGLRSYLAYEYSIGDQTLFEGIKKLMGGHILLMGPCGRKIEKYWDITEHIDSSKDDLYYIKRLRELLEQSARYRMIADVPIGAFLSGGLDSSAVVALARPHVDYDFHTFSMGFETFSELEYARMVSDHLDTVHHELIIDGKMVLGSLDKIAWHFDEPLGDAAIINNYFLSKEARGFVKVVLAGEAGDELFAGYSSYGNSLRLHRLRSTPAVGAVAQLVFKSTSLRQLMLMSGIEYLCGGARVINRLSQPSLEFVQLQTTRSKNNDEVSLETIIGPDNVDSHAIIPAGFKDPLNRILATDCKNLLPEKFLMKADKAIMANSVEERLPLMDKNIVEFAFSMPGTVKLRGKEEKYVLKMAVKDLLPAAIIKRKKQGFNTQIWSWIGNGAFKDRVIAVLGENELLQRTFKNKYRESILRDLKAGDGSRYREMWHAFALGLWQETYFGDEGQRA